MPQRETCGMIGNQQPRIGRIPLALIAVSHAAAVPSALSLFHLATQAFTLRKPSARQDAWHFDWQSESHPLAWPLWGRGQPRPAGGRPPSALALFDRALKQSPRKDEKVKRASSPQRD